jgi:hypothetical protein
MRNFTENSQAALSPEKSPLNRIRNLSVMSRRGSTTDMLGGGLSSKEALMNTPRPQGDEFAPAFELGENYSAMAGYKEGIKNDNGMSRTDTERFNRVADILQKVIIFYEIIRVLAKFRDK